MKTCRSCGQQKALDEFHRSSSSSDGRQSWCKDCSITAARQRALDKPDAKLAADRKYQHSEKHREKQRRYREAHADAVRERKRAAYARDREAINARARARRTGDPEFLAKSRARYARWRENHPRHVHRNAIRKLYGLTLDDYDAMVLRQEGRCAICLTPLANLHVDHCHATGRVRGLLCIDCNRGLGSFRDNPDTLTAAAAYVRT